MPKKKKHALSIDHLKAAGSALVTAGRPDLAADFLQVANSRQPFDPVLLTAYSSALRAADRLDDAEAAIRMACRLEPAPYRDLALACTIRERTGPENRSESVEILRRVVKAAPDYTDALGVLGLWLFEEWRKYAGPDENLGEAMELVDRATLDKACQVNFRTLRADLLWAHGRIDEWLAESESLAAAYPEDTGCYVSRAFALLATGNLRLGLPAIAGVIGRRLEINSGPIARVPQWRPNQPPGRVLLWGPDGAGDLIQMIRYAKYAAQHGAELDLACGGSMETLARRVEGIRNFIPAQRMFPDDPDRWTAQVDHDRYVTIYNLAAIFTTREEEIPAEPYLSADPEAVERWRKRLAHMPGLKVGITWRGNPAQDDDARRSFLIREFEPLFRMSGVNLISLQKGHLEDLADVPVHYLGDEYQAGDWHETAAVISNLDLVISPCTGIAHLAGGLGKPIWIALSRPCCWRWQLDRDDSPWYPSARLFRQTRPRVWSDVFDRIASALSQYQLHSVA